MRKAIRRLRRWMHYLCKEILIVITVLGSIASIVSGVKEFLQNNDWICMALIATVAVTVTYINVRVSRVVFRRKNAELKKVTARKRELEEIVLGEERRSSDYDPDRHDF